jgi:hypothetical protein
MGQTESTFVPPFAKRYLELTDYALERARRDFDSYPSSNEVTGGAELLPSGKIFGGNDIVKYDIQTYSKEKEKVIRSLMKSILISLEVGNAGKVASLPLPKLLQEMEKIIQMAKKASGKAKLSEKKAGKSVCDKLASTINSQFGQVIDPSLSPNDKCDRVVEFLGSLMTGLHTEFIVIAGDAKNILQNLRTLLEVIDRSYRRQMEIVESAGDQSRIQQSKQVLGAYEIVIKELKRQIQLLANILDSSIGPTRVNLIKELQRNKDLQGMVKDIRAEVGTTDFGTKLANLFAGIGSVAYAAQAVKEGINRLGITAKEYKAAKSPTELRTLVLNKIQGKKPTTQELDALMKAADLIEKYSFEHEEISKVLGGFEESEEYSGGIIDYDEKEITGGAHDEYWKRRSLSKKIKDKEKFREKVLKSFELNLRDKFRDIAREANIVSKAIGKEIPVTEANSIDLENFVTAFKRLSTLNRNNLHVALSGYLKDSVSKMRREEFLEEYRVLLELMEPLEKGSGGKLMKNLASAIKSMLKAIDDFSDTMVKPITSIHIEHPEESFEKATHVAEFLGSGAEDFERLADELDQKNSVLGGAEGKELSNSFVEFDRVKLNMAFNYTTTMLRQNIVDSSKTIEEWGKGYDLLLGETAGSIINKIKEEFNRLIEGADPNRDLPADFKVNDERTCDGYISRVSTIFHSQNLDKDIRVNAFKALAYLWKRQRDAKVKIVEAAQAIDLYLKAFAQAFAKDPDSISDALKMVEQSEMTVKWTTEHPGNILAALFECFPSSYDDNPSYSGDPNRRPLTLDTGVSQFLNPFSSDNNRFNHYFAWLDEHNDNLAGNPTLGIPLRGENAQKRVAGLFNAASRSLTSVRALSNILNLFLTVGEKFAGKNPMSETFMSIEEISKAINEYIVASSFTTGFAPMLGFDHGYNPVIFGSRTRLNGAAVALSTAAGRPDRNNFFPEEADTKREQFTLAIADMIMGDHVKINRRTQFNTPKSGPLSGVHGNMAVANEDENKLNLVSSVAMSSIPYSANPYVNRWVYSDPNLRTGLRVDVAGWRDFFYDTDLLFEMTLKSIINKVIAVVDTQRLFHRPSISRAAHSSLHPVRMIIGGADKTKIVPEALELYMRLPLLAEWYREMFGLKRDRPAASIGSTRLNDGIDEDALWRLSIVPSIDGTWSEFVNFIFDEAKHIEDGNYTEGQSQKIIQLINSIHKRYKSKYRNLTPRMVLTGFIEEMNRSFGFLKAQDIDDYFADKRKHYEAPEPGEDSDFAAFENFMDKDVYHRGNAPSAKFVTVGDAKSSETIKRRTMNLLESVENLRKRMDVDIQRVAGVEGELFGESLGFTETLRSYKQELANANDRDKYDIVLRMLQGTNKFLKLSEDKLIMVHEAVSAPIFALQMFARILVKFNSIMHGLAITNVNKWANAAETRAVAFATVADRYENYRTALRRFYPDSLGEEELTRFADELIGDAESREFDQGLQGYLGDVAKALNAPLPRGNIQYVEIMKTQLTALLDLVNNPNKLIELKVGSSGKLNVNFAPAKELFLTLLTSVKRNIHKLRTEFIKTPDILTRYEDGGREGSIPWFEENIVEKLFKNRDSTGLDIGVAHLQNSINFCADPDNTNGISLYQFFAENIFWGDSVDSTKLGTLTRNDLDTFPFNVAPVKIPAELRTNAQKTDIGNVRSGANVNGPLLDQILAAPFVSGLSLPYRLDDDAAMRAARKHYPTSVLRPNRFNNWNFTQRAGGLIERFNQIVHRYVNDNLSELLKFYTPLLEKFVYGPASYEFNQGSALPNVFTTTLDGAAITNGAARVFGLGTGEMPPAAGGVAPAGSMVAINNTSNLPFIIGNAAGARFQQTDQIAMPGPDGKSVLWHSLVITIRAIFDASDPKTKKRIYVYESLAEIKDNMKERMCTNLPYYSKLFREIQDRAQQLRELLAKTSMKNNLSASLAARNRTYQAGTQDETTPVNGSLPLKQRLTENSSDNATYFSGLLTHLIDLAASIKRCCDQVYKELQDSPPQFMETRKHFIAEYQNKYGVPPLLPASNVLLPLGTIAGNEANWNGFLDFRHKSTDSHDPSDYELLLPQPVSGSAAYQFNSAARLILARSDIEPNIDHIPGSKSIFNDFTKLVGHRSITKDEYRKTLLDMVKLARFLGDGASHSRLFATSLLPTRPDYTALVMGNAFPHSNETLTRNIYSSVATRSQKFWERSNARNFYFLTARTGTNIGIADALAAAVVAAPLNGPDFETPLAAANVLATAKQFFNSAAARNNRQLEEIKAEPNFAYDDEAVIAAANELVRFKANLAPTFQFTRQPHRRLLDTLDLAEGFDQRAKKEEFAQILGVVSETSTFSRATLRVHNLLDINKPPISMSALMQEVPFINLLNHSYSFDRLVHNIILPDYIQDMMKENTGKLTTENLLLRTESPVHTPREMMVKLMCHPYGQIWETQVGQFGTVQSAGKQYHALIGSLFSGNDSLHLGVPRYLSDQLWHKALLVSSAFVAGNLPVNDVNSARLPGDLPSHPGGPSAVAAQRSVLPSSANLVPFVTAVNGRYSPDQVIRALQAMPGLVRAWADAAVAAGLTGDVFVAMAERRAHTAAINGAINVLSDAMPAAAANAYDMNTGVLNDVTVQAIARHIDGLDSNTMVGVPGAAGDVFPPGVNFNAAQALLDNDFNQDGAANASFSVRNFFARYATRLVAALTGATATDPGTVLASTDVTDFAGDVANSRYSPGFGGRRLFPADIVTNATTVRGVDGFAPGAGGVFALGNAADANTINIERVRRQNRFYCTNDLIFYKVQGQEFRITTNNDMQNANVHLYIHLLDSILNRMLPEQSALTLHLKKFIVFLCVRAISDGVAVANFGDILAAGQFFSVQNFFNPRVRENTIRELIGVGPENTEELSAIQVSHCLFVRRLLQSIATNAPANKGDILKNIFESMIPVASFQLQRVSRRVARSIPSHHLDKAENTIWNLSPSHPFASPGLVFYDPKDRNNKVRENSQMTVGDTLYFGDLGFVRFNLKLTRTLIWLANSQRFLRMILERSLEEVTGPVVKGLPGISRRVTEFRGNEHYDPDEFVGNNPRYI